MAERKADVFLKKHLDKFLKFPELDRYSYNRGSEFLSSDSTNKYRIYVHDESLGFHCFSDSCTFDEAFDHSALRLPRGSYQIKKDSIFSRRIRSDGSLYSEAQAFNSDAKTYYSALKSLLESFEIFGYNYPQDKSFLKVYLNLEYYLIQTKSLDDVLKKEAWSKNDQLIKSYKNDWYLIKKDRPIDLG